MIRMSLVIGLAILLATEVGILKTVRSQQRTVAHLTGL
jgi:hypothetical protein